MRATLPVGTIRVCRRWLVCADAVIRRPRSATSWTRSVSPSEKNLIDAALLEHKLREDLNRIAPRVMGVLEPLKVVIDNFPEGQEELLEAVNNPEDESMGTRMVPLSRTLYIERNDFREDPPRKYYRLAPGKEVRLRYGYYITCVDVVKDPGSGEVTQLHCTYDPETKGGSSPDGRKVRGTIHWVSAAHALNAEVRLYDRLFTVDDPNGENFREHINPDSLEVLTDCLVETQPWVGRSGNHLPVRATGLLLPRHR